MYIRSQPACVEVAAWHHNCTCLVARSNSLGPKAQLCVGRESGREIGRKREVGMKLGGIRMQALDAGIYTKRLHALSVTHARISLPHASNQRRSVRRLCTINIPDLDTRMRLYLTLR